MRTWKVGDRVRAKTQGPVEGVVAKVTKRATRDSAMSFQRVRVEWDTGHAGSMSGAQLEEASEAVEADEVVCQRCGDSREPEDEGFAMIVRGEPCNCCQNEDEGLCRECGEMVDVDGLCFSCYEAGRDDYLTHRFRDE
jgi:hypothetical protein